MSIDEITNWKEQLKSIIEGLNDNQKDQLLKILEKDNRERREKRENEINLERERNNKIINAVKELGVETKIDIDWVTKTEFKLWNERYMIVTYDPIERSNEVKSEFRNLKREQTIEQLNHERSELQTELEMLKFLQKLWEQVGLSDTNDQVAMFKYLAWVDIYSSIKIYRHRG